MVKKGLCILIILLLTSPCLAAQLHGTIYDLSLDKVSGVVVELNTVPQQRIISTDGTYSFNVNPGNYKITAKQVAQNLTLAKAEEKIQIVNEGDYNLDLFLYPSFEEEESLLNSTGINIDDGTTKKLFLPLLVLVIILLAALISLIIFVYLKLNKRPAQTSIQAIDDDLEKVIQIIKSEGGRATQKEIRKQLPLSEAKVSLIITELEAKGLIEKIKKGRGNIVILKK